MCDVLNIRCMLVNEVIGNTFLAGLFFLLFYFIITSKLRIGFDTTMLMLVPIILIGGLMVAGFSAIYAFATAIAGLLIAWIFQEIIRARN